ncbi:MAG: helix-hairpin-helix domain-containing protein [Planctomycetota bacterium]
MFDPTGDNLSKTIFDDGEGKTVESARPDVESSGLPVLLNHSVQSFFAAAGVIALCCFAGVGMLVAGKDAARPYRLTIDLNSATSEELQLVPGVGKVTADRIIAARNSMGGFKSLNEVESVHGVGPKTVDELRNHCEVRDPNIPAENESPVKTLVAVRE